MKNTTRSYSFINRISSSLLISVIASLFFSQNLLASSRSCQEILEDHPFKEAFSSDMAMGPLSSRLHRFMLKYGVEGEKAPSVTGLSGIEIRFASPNLNWARTNNVLVISTEGRDLKELATDYVNMISENTVSFNLKSRAGHLYTRIGNQNLDYLGGLSTSSFIEYLSRGLGGEGLLSRFRRPQTRKALETVIELTPEELYRLEKYALNVKAAPDLILGGFSYEGVKVNETKGRLDDNSCTKAGGGHNCTSWLATAPIGENGERLIELVGGGHYNVGGNPGWWTGFLLTQSSSPNTNLVRVPFVVYWTTEPLKKTVDELHANPVIDWDFYPH